jgi:5'-3' exonuclease
VLFDRILLIDAGSLTAQSINVAMSKESPGVQDSMEKTGILPQTCISYGTYVFLQTFMSLTNNYGSPILCLDRYPVRKLNQFPAYKKDRFERYTKTYTNIEAGLAEVPEGEQLSLHQQFRQALVPLLNMLPCMTAWAAGEEADDTMATAVNQIGRVSQVPVFMFTRDTDMYQLVGSKPRFTIVYKSPQIKNHVIVNKEVVMEQYQVLPEQIPLYKAFLGDKGDSIPKIKKMHAKVIIRDVIADRTTVAEVQEAYEKGEIDTTKWHKNWKEYFEEHLPQAHTNELLARLDNNVNIVYEYGQGNYDTFAELYMQTLGSNANIITPLSVWNHFVGIATVLIRTLAKDQIQITAKT